MSRQEKCQKKPTQGALYAALPRVKSVPLRIPRRTYDSAEHLNLQTRHGKNVPIFAVLRTAVKTCKFQSLSCSAEAKCGREGYIGEGGSGAGKRSAVAVVNACPVDRQSRDRIARRQLASGQRLPYAAFFGYFLVRSQESNTHRYMGNETLIINSTFYSGEKYDQDH